MKKQLLSAFIGVIMMCTAGIGSATEYLLTSTKPNLLHLVDVKARSVSKTFEIPGAAPGALSIAIDETNAIAYVLANRWGSVIGMDLNTGEQVFRADLSQDGRRVRAIQGLEVSPDGKQVYVNCLPVKMGLGEYEVEDTYIAVYNTADGIDARPVRKIPVPRRVVILASSTDGSELYALGHELHVFDPKTGEHLRDHKIRNRDAKDRTPPDILDFWNQWEQAGIFSTPFFTVDTSKAEDDPSAYRNGILTMDLDSKEFNMEEYENFEVIIFSTVVNPVRRNEVYGVYTQLSKIDIEKDELIARKDMDHTYYAVNVSSDGTELYAGGTLNDIAIYDTETLDKIGSIEIPGGNMALSSMRMFDM
jgi:quinohemoprotein amine dehydrogenase beta subunit